MIFLRITTDFHPFLLAPLGGSTPERGPRPPLGGATAAEGLERGWAGDVWEISMATVPHKWTIFNLVGGLEHFLFFQI